jgi:hypothetical protein
MFSAFRRLVRSTFGPSPSRQSHKRWQLGCQQRRQSFLEPLEARRVLAQFFIGGDITVNTNWTTPGDEYVLVSPISVGNDATLTIGDGVLVRPQSPNDTLSIGNVFSLGTIIANPGAMIGADLILTDNSEGTINSADITGRVDYYHDSTVDLITNDIRGQVTIDPERVPELAGQIFPVGTRIAIFADTEVTLNTTWTKFPNVTGYQVLFGANSNVEVIANSTLTIDNSLEVELGQQLAIAAGSSISIGNGVTFQGVPLFVAGTITSSGNIFDGGIDLQSNAQGTLTNNVVNGPFDYRDNTQVTLNSNTLNGQVTIAPERVPVLAGQAFPAGTTIDIYSGSVMNTTATWSKFPNVVGYIVRGAGGNSLNVGNNAVLTIGNNLTITLNEPMVIDPSAKLTLGSGITFAGSTISVSGRITSTNNRLDSRIELNDTADGSLQSNLINGTLDFHTGTQTTLITNTLNGQVTISGRRVSVLAGQTFPATTVIDIFSDSVVNGDMTWAKFPNVVGYQVLSGTTFEVDNGATLTIDNDLTVTLNTAMLVNNGSTLELGIVTDPDNITPNNITFNGQQLQIAGELSSLGADFSNPIRFSGFAGGTLEDNTFSGAFEYDSLSPVTLINNSIMGQVTSAPTQVPVFAGQLFPANTFIQIFSNRSVTGSVTWPSFPNVTGYRVLGGGTTIVAGGTLTIADGLELVLGEPMVVNAGISVGGGVDVTGATMTINGRIRSIGGQFISPLVLSATSFGRLEECRVASNLSMAGLSTVELIHNDLSAGLTATGTAAESIDATNNFWGFDTSAEIEGIVRHFPDDNDLPSVNYGGFIFRNTIGSNVWLDSNRDGRRDINEVGVDGAIITIFESGPDNLTGTSDDVFRGTRVTNSSGFWSFTLGFVPAGTLFVQFTLPPNRIFAPRNGTDDTVDSDADLNFGRSQVFTLTPGGINLNQDAGVMVPGGSQPPVVSNLGPAVDYVENDPAVILTSTGQVVDPDNANFENGTMTVEITANSDVNDRLAIANQGNNPGQISVSGNTVRFSGQPIGVFTGGTGHTPMLFQFNANATPAAVQALIRRISFRTLGDTPFTPTRTVTFRITDGTNGTSVPKSIQVNVLAVSDNPTVGFSGTRAYVENDPPIVLAPAATVSDGDNLEFEDGQLTLSITFGGSLTNRLEIRSQGNEAGQIGISGSTVTYAGTSIGAFTGGVGNTPLVVTFNANASLTAVQALMRNLTFSVTGDNPSTISRTVELVVTDGDGGTSAPKTVTVTVSRTNDAPVLSGGTLTTYAENATPLKIGGSASIIDPDSPDFDTGNLTVSITANAHVNDRLSVLNVGNGPGQIGVSGSQVRYAGTQIGTMSGGAGFTPLVITLNSSATIASTRALINNITFRTLGENPNTATRTVKFALDDGDGGTSNEISSTVHVNATNDKPVIALSGAITYRENAAPTTLSPFAGVTDVDTPVFSGGKLTVRITANANSADRVAIRNDGNGAQQIGAASGKVRYEGILIGTYSGGSGAVPLVVNLNSNASIAATQALVRAITFRTIGDTPDTNARTVTFVLNDGIDDSTVATKTVNVTSVNDAPVLTGFGGSMGYVNNASSVQLATFAKVTDADSANFDGGKLSVKITSGDDASNRLLVSGVFVISGSNLLRSGVIIGTVNGDGKGLNDLEITFNDQATPSIVQELVRSIRFRTNSGTSTAQRKIAFSVTDGDGGSSDIVTKTVNVS